MMDKTFYPTHQGYLIKSPPASGIFRFIKRWRKRWFVLRDDKSLQYYTERGGRLIRTINLNICTCLERNVNHPKFGNLFSLEVKGRSTAGKKLDRIYLLSAETNYEMNLWIEEISKVCTFENYEDEKFGSPSRKIQPEESRIQTGTVRTTDVIGVEISSRQDRNKNIGNVKAKTSSSSPGKNKHGVDNVNGAYTAYDVPSKKDSQVGVPSVKYIEEKTDHDDYDVPPSSGSFAQQSYDVPPQKDSQICVEADPEKTGHDDYDVPSSNVKQQQQSYDVPRMVGASSTKDVSRDDGHLDDNRYDYDVPRLSLSRDSHHSLTGDSYDVPRKDDLSTYDVPSSDGLSASFHGDDQTYDIPRSSSSQGVHIILQNTGNDATYDTPSPKSKNKYVNLYIPPDT